MSDIPQQNPLKYGFSGIKRHNTCMYILYLRCEDAILAILCMSLPITTALAGEWSNSLIFHDNIKRITANVGVDYICPDDYSFCEKSFWEA